MNEVEDIARELVDVLTMPGITREHATGIIVQALLTFQSIGRAEGTKLAGDAIMKAFDKAPAA